MGDDRQPISFSSAQERAQATPRLSNSTKGLQFKNFYLKKIGTLKKHLLFYNEMLSFPVHVSSPSARKILLCLHGTVARFSVVPCRIRGPEGKVIPQQLHYKRRILVTVFVQSVQLGDGFVECLQTIKTGSRGRGRGRGRGLFPKEGNLQF
jgi:hypothetical protein